jgi:hypothetical protein
LEKRLELQARGVRVRESALVAVDYLSLVFHTNSLRQ